MATIDEAARHPEPTRPSEPNARRPRPANATQNPRRQLTQDAESLMQDVRDVVDGVQEYLERQVKERPYTTVAIAAGAGYVLGGGLATRVNRTLFSLASRIAIGVLAREIGMRLDLVRDGDMPHGAAIQ